MTITLTRDAFNAIMRTCKDVAKGSHYVGLDRDTLRLICRDSRVTAVALNNASIVEVTVPCEQPSDDGEMLVPVLKLAGKNELIVSISHENGVTSVLTAERDEKYELELKDTPFKGVEAILPKNERPMRSVCFDPHQLCQAITAMKATGTNSVQISFYKDWKTGVVITAPHAKACVLPVRREDNF